MKKQLDNAWKIYLTCRNLSLQLYKQADKAHRSGSISKKEAFEMYDVADTWYTSGIAMWEYIVKELCGDNKIRWQYSKGRKGFDCIVQISTSENNRSSSERQNIVRFRYSR